LICIFDNIYQQNKPKARYYTTILRDTPCYTMCWVQNFEEVSYTYELFDNVLRELTKPKPPELVANWQMLPPDVVNIVLELLEQYNFQFYTNNFMRIDTIPNSATIIHHYPLGTHVEKKTYRFVGTPPVDTSSKFITPEVVLHKQSLPFIVDFIGQELEKRNVKSVDSCIKPSKMKCKYVKNIVTDAYVNTIIQMRWGREWNGVCSSRTPCKSLLEGGKECLEWILDHQ